MSSSPRVAGRHRVLRRAQHGRAPRGVLLQHRTHGRGETGGGSGSQPLTHSITHSLTHSLTHPPRAPLTQASPPTPPWRCCSSSPPTPMTPGSKCVYIHINHQTYIHTTTRAHTHIHTHAHTYIHTYTHIHVHRMVQGYVGNVVCDFQMPSDPALTHTPADATDAPRTSGGEGVRLSSDVEATLLNRDDYCAGSFPQHC